MHSFGNIKTCCIHDCISSDIFQKTHMLLGLCPELATVKLTSQHSYNTRRNQKLLMDQLEHNQVVMREDMTAVKAQMGQLVKAIQALARGQEEMRQDNLRVVVANPPIVTRLVNPPEGAGTPVITQPPPERVPVYQNAAQTFNIHINGRAQPEMDDHQDAFFTTRADLIYDAFGPSPADFERRFHMMEDEIKAIEGPDTFGGKPLLLIIPKQNSEDSVEQKDKSATRSSRSEAVTSRILLKIQSIRGNHVEKSLQDPVDPKQSC
ncbi:hypothetical protein KIW84_055338 [Lathyrus oleraceus]|uniref:Uncharacterized protein n=1 Tax=Pisum sativum TaxID=3888 RepID=A0A9D5AJT2_PEA|nr:hypothetical protein KIW84_055338 [Pisum sativum]